MGNAVLLRADVHSLFDSGLLSIDENGVIDIAGVAEGSKYHAEFKSGNWNRMLEPRVLNSIKRALKARASRLTSPVA